jgi:metal-dependent amidase/aminoacylase/carboxypeptidase family protein
MADGLRNDACMYKGENSMKKNTVFAAAALSALGVSIPVCPVYADTAHTDTLRDAVAKDMPSLMELYRDLHANPELSFQELKTAAKLATEARRLGYDVTEKVGKTGVVAVLKNGAGPVVMIRADMDGLPVEEQTGLPFASKQRGVSKSGTVSGIMHACGHDTHMSA